MFVFSCFQKKFNHETLLDSIEKTKQTFALTILTNYIYATSYFDFWMFKAVDDIFILIVDFWGIFWMPEHITIGLFEIFEYNVGNFEINS